MARYMDDEEEAINDATLALCDYQKVMLDRIGNYVTAYNAMLHDLNVKAVGEDYEMLAEGIDSILLGRLAPPIIVTRIR